MRYKDKYESSKFRVISWHFTFMFVSLTFSGLLLYRTNWLLFSVVDVIKILICLVLLMLVLRKAYKNRNISPKVYIEKWEEFIDNDE